nr:hypothetical protein [Candidatus Sigynarchaeota archaeon]
MAGSSKTLLFGCISLLLGIISVAVWDLYTILAIAAVILGLATINGATVAKVLSAIP